MLDMYGACPVESGFAGRVETPPFCRLLPFGDRRLDANGGKTFSNPKKVAARWLARIVAGLSFLLLWDAGNYCGKCETDLLVIAISDGLF